MMVLSDPIAATHTRSGRFVQRERPAANIPTRIRARRLTMHAQRFVAAQRSQREAEAGGGDEVKTFRAAG